MGLIKVPKRRIRTNFAPSFPVKVNPYWIQRGLTSLYIPSIGQILLRKKTPVLSGAVRAVSDMGIATRFAGGSKDLVEVAADADELIGTAQGTIFMCFRFGDTTARAVQICGFAETSSVPERAILQPWSDGNFYFDWGGAAAGGGRVSATYTKDILPRCVTGISGGGKGKELWFGTTKVASNAGDTTARPATALPFNWGTASGNAAQITDAIDLYIGATFSEPLSDSDVQLLSTHRFKTLLKPANDSIWIPVSAGLPGAYTLTADSASFSITGNNAGLKAGRKLQAATSSFAVTGNTAAIKADRRLSATTASYAVTGIDAALTYSPLAKTLTATVGSFVLTGNATALRADRRLSAVVGSYALTAQAANLSAARRMAAQTASYAITGNIAGLRAARRLMATAASYTLTGIDVGLTKSNQRTLSAATASFAVTGVAATLKADRRLLAQTGQIVLTGQPARLARGYRLSAGAGAYGLTGQAAGFRRAYRLAAIHAQFALTGNAVNLVYAPNFDGVLAFSPGSMLSYQRRITKVDGQPRIRSIR